MQVVSDASGVEVSLLRENVLSLSQPAEAGWHSTLMTVTRHAPKRWLLPGRWPLLKKYRHKWQSKSA